MMSPVEIYHLQKVLMNRIYDDVYDVMSHGAILTPMRLRNAEKILLMIGLGPALQNRI